FPLAVTELKKLRKLDLSDNAFKAIPEKILNLENLEELNLDGSLSHVRTIPDFSKLKNLKTLNLNGLPSELLAQVFRATSLEHLYVGHLRPPLNTLPEAIGDLVHLKTLDGASNNITHLPKAFSACQSWKPSIWITTRSCLGRSFKSWQAACPAPASSFPVPCVRSGRTKATRAGRKCISWSKRLPQTCRRATTRRPPKSSGKSSRYAFRTRNGTITITCMPTTARCRACCACWDR